MKPLSADLMLAVVVVAALVVTFWAALRAAPAAPAGDGPRDRARSEIALAALGLVVFAVYLSNGKRLIQGDSQPATFAAVSLVRSGDLDIDEFRPGIDPILAWTVTAPNRHIYSMYPPGSAIALAPFVAATTAADMPLSIELLDALAKLAASFWTALSAVILFAALRRYAPAGALAATIAYAFATTAFSSASQDLWQHGPSQAGLALALYLLVRAGAASDARARAAFHFVLGAALGWAVICRTTNVLPAAVIAGYVLARDRKGAAFLAVGALPFALFTLEYNRLTTGSPWKFAQTVQQGGWTFHGPFFAGFANLLLSPSRGMLVYSPFLAAAIVGAAREMPALRRAVAPAKKEAAAPGMPPLAALGALAGLSLLLMISKWNEWHGGWSYGYRIVSEVALLLMPGFAAIAARLAPSRLGRGALVVLVAWSIGVHALQVYFPNDAWNAERLGKPWSGRLSDTQIGWHLRFLGEKLASDGRPPRQAGGR